MSCNPSSPTQTQFLGASVADFNVSMGWGGQASQLTVTLVEDFNCGSTSSGGSSGGSNRVYYTWDRTVTTGSLGVGLQANYTTGPDPGFAATRSSPVDIINCPCFFKLGSVEFFGVVRSWEKTKGSGGVTYTVNIDGMESVLDKSYIICNKYSGSIFTKTTSGDYGAPFNITNSSALVYTGSLDEGVIPNVFNAFGLLEAGGFGGSSRNDRGVPANSLMDALTVLTSCVDPATTDLRFSPLGRIIFANSFGGANSIPSEPDGSGANRVGCLLDISELGRCPSSYRINQDVMTISEFVSNIAGANGYDYYWSPGLFIDNPGTQTVNSGAQGNAYLVLKLKTRSRSNQLPTNTIQNTIDDLNLNVSSVTIGKEKSDITNRVMIIGGNQQRVYQATSKRLSYSQSNYVWHPITGDFINIGQYTRGSVRTANELSIRNPNLSYSASRYNELSTTQQEIQDTITSSFASNGNYTGLTDTYVPIATINNGITIINPPPAVSSFDLSFPTPPGYNAIGGRYLPLMWDIIFPFFGFVGGDNSTVPEPDSTSENPTFKPIRPVYMDTWTNNLCIEISAGDLPLNMQANLSGGFLVTESEIRAAMSGWDAYLTYCMTKGYKPDLYAALMRAYSGNHVSVDPDTDELMSNKTPGATHEEGLTANQNVANNLGYLVGGQGVPMPDLTININFILNPDMLRDFIKISEFVASFSQFYGKSYMVRVPKATAYRDMDTNNIFTTTTSNGDIHGYSGSGKLFYSFEPAPDGGWEEYGNLINNDIVVGSGKWYSLIDDSGKIPPILAYNARNHIDWIQQNICSQGSSAASYRYNLGAMHSLLNAAYFRPTATTGTGGVTVNFNGLGKSSGSGP